MPGPPRIRIGNQTSFAAATPTEPFEYAVANGFDAFEWFPDPKPDGAGWDVGDLDLPTRRAIHATAAAHGMRLSVHARGAADPLAAGAQPAFRAEVELAQDLGAALLNVHLSTRAGLAGYVGAITPLMRATAEAGVQLSIENTPATTPEDLTGLFARLAALDTVPVQHVGMCLDLGHANLCPGTRNDYLRYFDLLGPQVPVRHLHLHENWGDADSHLTVFTGPAGRDDAGVRGCLERLRRRGYSGSIILEQWPQPPALLNAARERLLRMLAV